MRPLVITFAATLVGLLGACDPASAQLRIPGIPRPPPSCEWRHDGADELVHLGSIMVSAADQPISYVRLVSAADMLVIRFPTAWRPSSASIRVSSKPAGDWSFGSVCSDVNILRKQETSVLSARDALRGIGSVWRVELRVSSAKRADRIDLYVPRSGAQVSNEPSNVDPWNAASGLLCVGGIAATEIRPAPSQGFSGRVKLHLDISQEKLPVTPVQSEALTALVLRAVSLWVVACSGCRAEHLAAVTVGDKQFVREEIASWYARELGQGGFVSGRLPELERNLAETLEPIEVLMAGNDSHEWPRAKELSRYRRYSSNEFADLCALTVPSSRAVLPTIQRAICANLPLEREALAKIRIRFRTSSTGCGDAADVIACRTDQELTEYNARDFRFSFADSTTPAVGNGPVELDLLHAIVHEMGHWIGVPHVEGGESIMASSLEHSRCIDMPTIRALVDSQDAPLRGRDHPQAFTLNERPRSSRAR